jgi:hypothetical protein
MNPKIWETGAKERRDIGAEPGIKTRSLRITLGFRLVGGEHRRSEKSEKAGYGNPVLVHVLLGNERFLVTSRPSFSDRSVRPSFIR